jgi:hypothetical protein
MAEIIQFNCPVCGTALRLPLALAAQQGPCPHCGHEIIAPDPYWGVGALQVAVASPRPEPEPFRPFVDATPPVKEWEMTQPDPEPAAPELPTAPVIAEPAAPVKTVQVPICAKPQRTVLVLSCLLSALVALVCGYVLGMRANSVPSKPQPETVAQQPPKSQLPVATAGLPMVEPAPVLVTPKVEAPLANPPKVEKKPEPKSVSAAAEASLRAFLEAPDWAARCAYVLHPGKVKDAMEAYSRQAPDGPTPYQSIAVKQSIIDEKTGYTLYVFYVITEKFPDGIPVAVQETPVGWLVDWQPLVEFRDELFRKFTEGPPEQSGQFHLAVTTPPKDRAATTENEYFSSFLLQAPLEKTAQLAFVKKDSETFNVFQAAVAGGAPFTPVLEVAKRKTSEGQSYFEVTKVVATDWRPVAD